MRFLIAATLASLALGGCAVSKDWQATGGSRSDGVVRLSYEYKQMQAAQTNDQQGLNLAVSRCGSWGYTGSEAFGRTKQTCNQPGGLGCASWLVTKEYQCLGHADASAQLAH
jgi:hypothetical protein